jgi:hypothetical protein
MFAGVVNRKSIDRQLCCIRTRRSVDNLWLQARRELAPIPPKYPRRPKTLTRRDLAELLIANNADVNARDNKSETPLHVVRWRDREGVAELPRQRGAR